VPPGVAVIIDELSQSACPLRGLVNVSVVVPPALLLVQLKGLTLQDGIVQELWGYSTYFTVHDFPSLNEPPPLASHQLPPPCAADTTVTIVTASILIEPNRHDFTRGLRSILQLGCPTIVYGDAAAAEAVASHLNSHPLHRVSVINISLTELQSWRHHAAIQRRATPEFCRVITWTSQHSLYLTIVLLKPIWLLQAATENVFETELVLWLDASPRCLGHLKAPMRLKQPYFGDISGKKPCAVIHRAFMRETGVAMQSKWVNPTDVKVSRTHLHPTLAVLYAKPCVVAVECCDYAGQEWGAWRAGRAVE
jgi:hypothetical protein